MLAESQKGPTEFTIARAHAHLKKFRIGTLVLVFGTEGEGEDGDVPDAAWLGVVNYRAAVTTLESSIRVANGFELKPNTEDKIAALIKDISLASTVRRQLQTDSDAFLLSPKVSVGLVTALADKNSLGLSRLAAYLDRPATFRGNVEMQTDALKVAMKLFDLAPSNRPDEVYVHPNHPTAIGQISLLEDTVIQHDTHSFPGLDFVESELTGRVLFRKADEEIEIFTANKLPLEKAMGVDLVYLNLVKSNVALVQYKMLKPVNRDKEKDWIYRPDDQLEVELKRMDTYAKELAPDESEYRISPGAFYLKFVQRDGQLGKGILLPIDYFRRIQKDPNFKGTRGNVVISYNSLGGRYIREDAFLSLVRHGLIGPYAKTTQAFAALIGELVKNNHAIVGAIARKQGTVTRRRGKAKQRINIEDTGETDL